MYLLLERGRVLKWNRSQRILHRIVGVSRNEIDMPRVISGTKFNIKEEKRWRDRRTDDSKTDRS